MIFWFPLVILETINTKLVSNMSEKEKIIQYSLDRFIQNGLRNTTVDQIAKEMKISKKTIYKHFTSKDELIRSTVHSITHNLRSNILQIIDREINAIEKLIEISKVFFGIALKFSEHWFNDLRTHYYDIWLEIEEFREKAIKENFTKIITQGKSEQYFVDQPTDLLLIILLSSVQGVINPEFLTNHKYTAKEAAQITFDIIFSGIMTKKGRKFYKQLKMEKLT